MGGAALTTRLAVIPASGGSERIPSKTAALISTQNRPATFLAQNRDELALLKCLGADDRRIVRRERLNLEPLSVREAVNWVVQLRPTLRRPLDGLGCARVADAVESLARGRLTP